MQLSPEEALDLDLLEALPAGKLGVAVSGGGDSVALLQILNDWGKRDLAVVTVDHGLRGESADEARAVGVIAHAMGHSHDILVWERPGRRGNLQGDARTARLELISGWARARKLAAVALAHTADDQAETFLMRLARGSGVEGLASMEPSRKENGVLWVRPLLGQRREALRAHLEAVGATYYDDPSNEDTQFERVRVRRALGTLGALGIDVDHIARTTERLRSAKQVVYAATRDLSHLACRLSDAGEMEIDLARLRSAQAHLQLRLVSEAVRFVSGSYYAPRAYMVENLLKQLGSGLAGATLHGCLLRENRDRLLVRREPGKTEGMVPVGSVWDGRWQAKGDGPAMIGALGEAGLAQCENWRAAGHARETLLTTPGIWQGDALVAAPLAGLGADRWRVWISLTNPFFDMPQAP